MKMTLNIEPIHLYMMNALFIIDELDRSIYQENRQRLYQLFYELNGRFDYP
jgi:hypothetical protein